ncbi:MAG: hypothetical protein FJ137_07430 [Deltaproteobacteria bacterium]|nr:hypothetical protein [Deltaproteobacteria bacterium]
MAIPRRVIAVALSAVAFGAVYYVSTRRRRQDPLRGAVDDANAEKERVAAEQERAAAAGRATGDGAQGTEGGAAVGASAGGAADSAARDPERPGPPSATTKAGAVHELALFLAGDAWHDEIGWQALWEKEGVTSAAAWLRTQGCVVLSAERRKLVDHPALLAGCRRRWIVVCRYGGIDVGDAASLWNTSEST